MVRYQTLNFSSILNGSENQVQDKITYPTNGCLLYAGRLFGVIKTPATKTLKHKEKH
jgi:hypothetical protein